MQRCLFPSLDKSIPPALRKNAWKFRAGYMLTYGASLYLLFHERKTDLWVKNESLNWETATPFFVFIALSLLTYLLIQGSDPGYLGDGSSEESYDDHLLFADSDEEEHGDGTGEPLELEAIHLAAQQPAGSAAGRGSGSSAQQAPADGAGAGSDDGAGAGAGTVAGAGAGTVAGAGAGAAVMAGGEAPQQATMRAVATYDHFCLVLGTCIGERNRFRFWQLLLAHSVVIWWSIGFAFSGFHYRRTWGEWWSENGYAFFITVLSWIYFLYVCSLLVFHSWLLATNTTSYEFVRHERVRYLRGFRQFDLPFSRGLCTNLRMCVAADGMWSVFGRRWTPVHWPAPAPVDRESTDVWNNMWENKYWSCC